MIVSPWISYLVIVKKKSGGLRACVDLRAVNKSVVPDKYPLPTAEELTFQFYGSKIFSKLDLRQATYRYLGTQTAVTSTLSSHTQSSSATPGYHLVYAPPLAASRK